MNLHPASLDDVYVVLRAGVEAVSAERAPEVAPQSPGPSDHGSHDGPGERQQPAELRYRKQQHGGSVASPQYFLFHVPNGKN